jgi:mannosyltransferase
VRGYWDSLARSLARKLSNEVALVTALVVAAFVSRFYALGTESVWLDEAITFHRSQGTIASVIADSELHHHNPAYFLFMHAWLTLGDDEFMLRAPSAFFGALTVPAGYFLGRIVGGRWVAAAAAIVLLTNPRLVAYAQEARMYAPYVLGISIAIVSLIWLVANPTESQHPLLRLGKPGGSTSAAFAWVGCSLGWVIALYCQATAALAVLSCSLVALLRILLEPRERLRFLASFTVAGLLAVAAYTPWLFRLGGQVRAVHETFWAVFPSAERVGVELGPSFFFGNDVWRWLLVGCLALAGSYVLRQRPLVLASLWLLSLLGPGLVLLVSLWQPIFMHRQFLWACVPFAVIVGAGLTIPKHVSARVVCLSAALAAGAWALHTEYYEPYDKERWRDTIAFVRRSAHSDDKVIAASQSVKRLFEYYFSRKTSPLRRFRYERAQEDTQLPTPGRRGGLWVVSRGQRKEIRARLAAQGWELLEAKRFGKGIEVGHYGATSRAFPIPRAGTALAGDASAGPRRRRTPETPGEP